MIDAKIHGKFIFAEIKLDQADCHEFARDFFCKNLFGKIWIPRRFLKNFREDF